MKRVFLGFLVISAALATTGCSPNNVKINGKFVGNDSLMVYLERVLPTGQVVVDSVLTNDKGAFRFKFVLPGDQPTIYNIVSRQERIPLLLEPGERVRINSVGSIARNYVVEGSEGSAQMRELRNILVSGSEKMDSIMRVYTHASEDQRSSIVNQYMDVYYGTKKEHIKFIVTNPGSLVSLYALYQRLPNDTELFIGENDIIYYREVANHVSETYPDSPYVKALLNEIASYESSRTMMDLINEKMNSSPDNYPDLELPDMYNRMQRLSDFQGDVILIDFWSAADPNSKLLNAELKQLYDSVAADGFTVYQVSVDMSRPVWVTAVQEQRLPWVSVNDLQGNASLAVRSYNLSSIPANFLIDRRGNIVARDIYGEELARKVRELL